MGASIYVLWDNNALSHDRAAKGKCLGWHGCRVGDREFRLWAYPFGRSDHTKAYLIDLLLNRRRTSPIHIDERKAREVADRLRTFRPRVVYGWTSGLYKFAQIVRDTGIAVDASSVKLVISTSEQLHAHQRKVMNAVFPVPVVDEYGCSEAGVLAFECPAGNRHLLVENTFLEVVNRERYADGLGEIVVTNLHNLKMPLIRYRLGDVGATRSVACPCGRRTPILADVSGRVLDFLIDSDGGTVLGPVFCYLCFDLIDKYKAIKDFRVRQGADGSVVIYFERAGESLGNFLPLFEKAVRRHLGDRLPIDFVEKANVSEMDAGKARYVVSVDARRT